MDEFPHPFPSVSLEDRGHGRGVSHLAMPNGSWIAVQHDHPSELQDSMLDAWWAAWMEHGRD